MTFELIIVIALGLIFGSFVTLASWRLPRDEDIVVKPSHCPSCLVKLRFLDLWPILSWVGNRGKCRHCKVRVSVRYPLTEIGTAAGFVLLYLLFGLKTPALLLMLMWVALMVMIVVDIEHYIIPDEIHYVLLPLGVLYHLTVSSDLEDVAYGFMLGAAIGLSLHYGYRFLRKKEGLGFGDVKFMAVAGLWLGLKPIVPFLFLSGVLGVFMGLLWRALGKGPIFPFGPSLAVSLFLCVVFKDAVNLFWHIGEYIINTK